MKAKKYTIQLDVTLDDDIREQMRFDMGDKPERDNWQYCDDDEWFINVLLLSNDIDAKLKAMDTANLEIINEENAA